MVNCRECEYEINQATEICPHCGADLTALGPGMEAPKPPPTIGKILMRWGILLSVLLAAIWSFLWFVVPERRGDPTTQAETSAVQALGQVRFALTDYASAQSGAFPRQFESLDQTARAAAQLAQSVNYQIQYTPGPVSPDGSVRSFTLEARAGNYGFRNFFTDESGVIRATRENRPATAQDPPL